MSTELGERNLAAGDTGRAKQDIDDVTKKPVPFDASKHLAYSPQKEALHMSDIGYPSTAISEVASTNPFPLLSYEG
jgi:hypothetical protein